MKYRKLRIAWSVAWGVVCVLLIVLWVRSYVWFDFLYLELTATQAVDFGSIKGSVLFVEFPVSRIPPVPPIRLRNVRFDAEPQWPYLGFQLDLTGSGTLVSLPHWFVTLLVMMLASLARLRLSPQFSLRTLLIATTLIAVGLGLLVWAAKG